MAYAKCMTFFYIKILYKGVKKMNYLNVKTNEEKAFELYEEIYRTEPRKETKTEWQLIW